MKKFGLIGYPLGHSFSKKFFSEKFEKEGISECEYDLYPIESIELFPNLVSKIGKELVGLNCTIPYKAAIIPFLDSLSEEANSIQAVNTIFFSDGIKKGFNTDIPGFESTLINFIPTSLKKALVLGNGGSAKAVKYVLNRLGIEYKVVSRNPDLLGLAYTDLNRDIFTDYNLIVNTTPLGMYPKVDSCPDLDYSQLGASHYLYDLVYNPTKTLFLQHGEKQGAHIMNGLPMLVAQAEASWKIWNS